MVVDIVLFIFLVIAAVFTIIELGLSIYEVSQGTLITYEYNTPGGYTLAYEKAAASPQVDFLLFCSIWCFIVIIFQITIPLMWVRSPGRHGWLSPVILTLNSLTMIFWLAGFAALSSWYDVVHFKAIKTGPAGQAFSILLWFMFLLILIVNILTATGAVSSNRLGYDSLRKRKGKAPEPTGPIQMVQNA